MQADGPAQRRTITFSAVDTGAAERQRLAFEQLCVEHGIVWRYVRGSILLGPRTVLSCEYEFPAGTDLSPLRHLLLSEAGPRP